MTEPNRKQRTLSQNAALHKYCELLAEALNDAGFDMRSFPWKEGVDIPWNKDMVKEYLWKPVMEVMTGKHSTTEMNTVDPSEIYEVVNRHIAQTTGVQVDWPSEESLMYETEEMQKQTMRQDNP